MKKNNKGIILLGILCGAGVLLLLLGSLILPNASSKNVQKEEEKDLACFLCETYGVDNAVVKLHYDENGKPESAAVICTGGGDPVVRAEVTALIAAALGIGTNKIYVAGS